MYSFGSGRIGLGDLTDTKIPSLLYFNKSNDSSGNDIGQNSKDNKGGEIDIEFIDFSAGRSHSLAVDNKFRVWTFGEGSSGELGNNGITHCKYPILNKYLENEKIVSVSCWNQSYAITIDGRVYEWGSTLIDGSNILIPRLIIEFKYPIKSIYCSLNNSIAITTNGIPIIIKNRNGHDQQSIKPIEYFIENKIEIISVSCGVKHYLLLDNKGQVYSMGSGISTGVLLDDESTDDNDDYMDISKTIPNKLEELKNIIEISAGYYHSLALDGNLQQVWSWGENLNGQIGIEGIEYSIDPILIELPSVQITHIECGAYHSSFVTTDGELIMLGGALIVNDDFRMSIALGNGDGGFQTIQFKVDATQDETVISENIKFTKPDSQLINVQVKQSTSSTDNEKQNKDNQDTNDNSDTDDDDGNEENKDDLNDNSCKLTQEEILEFQFHFNELSHYDSARYQFSPQFINSFKNDKVVIDKVSCGMFHTLVTFKRNQIPSIESLANKCIKFISDTIIQSMETDTSFQDIYKLPIEIVLKIDSYLILNRQHSDKSQRLMSYLKSSFKNNNNNNNTTTTTTSTSTSTSTDNPTTPTSESNQWDHYLDYFSKDFDANLIVTLDTAQILTKTNGFEITDKTIKEIINGFNSISGVTNNTDDDSNNIQSFDFSNYKIQIPKYNDFVIIKLTDDKLVAINKKYTCVIDKTNLLIIMSIFKRSLLTKSQILKDFENLILQLKINGY